MCVRSISTSWAIEHVNNRARGNHRESWIVGPIGHSSSTIFAGVSQLLGRRADRGLLCVGPQGGGVDPKLGRTFLRPGFFWPETVVIVCPVFSTLENRAFGKRRPFGRKA